MSSFTKVQELKNKILDNISESLDWFMTLCESEIEKQLFLIIVTPIINDKFYPELESGIGGKGFGYRNWNIKDFEFIYDRVEWLFIDKEVFNVYTNKGYVTFGPDLIRPKALKFKDQCDFFIENQLEYTIYELIPQFEVELSKKYRLDFAIIAKNYIEDKQISITKVAIECDGYEYHYTKEQQRNDSKKNRELQLNDWKLYRMSGSEIFNIKTNAQIFNILTELRILTK
jgi:very-short-patch-repair endonuclease